MSSLLGRNAHTAETDQTEKSVYLAPGRGRVPALVLRAGAATDDDRVRDLVESV